MTATVHRLFPRRSAPGHVVPVIADVCTPVGDTLRWGEPPSDWPARILEHLGRPPRIGDWYCECSRLDLRQVDAVDLEELLEQYQDGDTGGSFYRTRLQALEDLERWYPNRPNSVPVEGDIVAHSTVQTTSGKRPWLCRLGCHAWNVWRATPHLAHHSGSPVIVKDMQCTRCPAKRTRVTKL